MRTDTREKILKYICRHQRVWAHDLIRELSLSAVAVHKQLNSLVESGQVRKIGKPPRVYYKLAKKKGNAILSYTDTKVLNYRIIIEPEKYDDGSLVYVAYCPTLGISDYGDTVEEVLISIKEGVELAVDSLAKANHEVPADRLEDQIITSTKISLPSSLHFSLA